MAAGKNEAELLFPSVPVFRVYEHHTGCQQGTEVGGHDYVNLCDPLVISPGTMCAACGRAFGYKNFRWADTQEVLSVYRKRMNEFRPQVIKHWCKSGFWKWGIGVWLVLTIAVFVFVPQSPHISPQEQRIVFAVASLFLFPFICLGAWEVGRQILRKHHPFDYRQVR